MEQSPWKSNWSAASQEIPRILWNPKVHHRTHKRTPPVNAIFLPVSIVHIVNFFFVLALYVLLSAWSCTDFFFFLNDLKIYPGVNLLYFNPYPANV